MPRRRPRTRLRSDMVAAVDLGSNSFHMIVARVVGGRLQVIDRKKEMVRLAAGLTADNRLSRRVMERGLACLAQFGERLRDITPANVRVVGTNTLRKARNAREFIRRARTILGHDIDIISGAEEARLIYLGVAHSVDDGGGRRLVIDIGGGSTEVIIGRRFEPQLLESLYIGCVAVSQRYFGAGRISAERMRAAKLAARQEFEHIAQAYRKTGWKRAIGASGTILAVRDLVAQRGWSTNGITRASLHRLERALLRAGRVDKLVALGVDPERAPVFAGGLAILAAAFDALRIDRLHASTGALREGLLYDLIGRIHREDVRERTVNDLAARYQVDIDHARRVAKSALELLGATALAWRLDVDTDGRLLRWSALLHEMGLAISHGQYHKHGAYLLRNLDMPGFARGEQNDLAQLVRAHRRKLPEPEFDTASASAAERMQRLIVLLRLAVLLHRSRDGAPLPRLGVDARDSGIRLQFPRGWLARHPLSEADLTTEAEYLRASAFKLRFA